MWCVCLPDISFAVITDQKREREHVWSQCFLIHTAKAKSIWVCKYKHWPGKNRKCLMLNLSSHYFCWFEAKAISWCKLSDHRQPTFPWNPLAMALCRILDFSMYHSHWEVILQPNREAIQKEIFLLHQFAQSQEWCSLPGLCIVLRLIFYLGYPTMSYYSTFTWIMKISA